MPRVSILIPCYNAESWVAAAIQSALDQTHPDKEVIVVDDGSTDGSPEIIKSFGDRIRWETGPNRGGNVARNRLLQLSTGEWLQFLDADDYLLDHKIADQLSSVTRAANIDAVYSPVLIESWVGGQMIDRSFAQVDREQCIYEQWIRWQVAQTGAVLWRRKSLVEIGGWNEDYPCCQDNEVTLRALKSGLNFSFCDESAAVYRVWSDSTVCHKDPRQVIELRTSLISDLKRWLEFNGQWNEQLQTAVDEIIFQQARTLAQQSISRGAAFLTSQSLGQPRPTSDSAPPVYRAIFSILGFRSAELTANFCRRFRREN